MSVEMERTVDSIQIGARHRTEIGDLDDLVAYDVASAGPALDEVTEPELLAGIEALAALARAGADGRPHTGGKSVPHGRHAFR